MSAFSWLECGPLFFEPAFKLIAVHNKTITLLFCFGNKNNIDVAFPSFTPQLTQKTLLMSPELNSLNYP